MSGASCCLTAMAHRDEVGSGGGTRVPAWHGTARDAAEARTVRDAARRLRQRSWSLASGLGTPGSAPARCLGRSEAASRRGTGARSPARGLARAAPWRPVTARGSYRLCGSWWIGPGGACVRSTPGEVGRSGAGNPSASAQVGDRVARQDRWLVIEAAAPPVGGSCRLAGRCGSRGVSAPRRRHRFYRRGADTCRNAGVTDGPERRRRREHECQRRSRRSQHA